MKVEEFVEFKRKRFYSSKESGTSSQSSRGRGRCLIKWNKGGRGSRKPEELEPRWKSFSSSRAEVDHCL